jgi:hypothetical protein
MQTNRSKCFELWGRASGLWNVLQWKLGKTTNSCTSLKNTKKKSQEGDGLRRGIETKPSTGKPKNLRSIWSWNWPTFLLQFCTYIHTLEAMVMPRSRSRAMESIARSRRTLAPHCRSIRSSSVVLSWSTCAMMATLRMDDGDTTFVVDGGRIVHHLWWCCCCHRESPTPNCGQERQTSRRSHREAPRHPSRKSRSTRPSSFEEETLPPHTPAIALPRQPELELLLCLQGFGLGLGFGSGSGLGFKALNPSALPRPLWKTRDEARTGVGFCLSSMFWSISSLAVV